MIPPKRFDIYFPLVIEGCSEGLDTFIFFFKNIKAWMETRRSPDFLSSGHPHEDWE